MHFWVYVLKSIYDGSIYTGNTVDLEERIGQHNKGKNRYTKGRRPWKLIYSEMVKSRSSAVKRERYLKSGIGRRELEKLLPK